MAMISSSLIARPTRYRTPPRPRWRRLTDPICSQSQACGCGGRDGRSSTPHHASTRMPPSNAALRVFLRPRDGRCPPATGGRGEGGRPGDPRAPAGPITVPTLRGWTMGDGSAKSAATAVPKAKPVEVGGSAEGAAPCGPIDQQRHRLAQRSSNHDMARPTRSCDANRTVTLVRGNRLWNALRACR
jgi:hypothetical protein